MSNILCEEQCIIRLRNKSTSSQSQWFHFELNAKQFVYVAPIFFENLKDAQLWRLFTISEVVCFLKKLLTFCPFSTILWIYGCNADGNFFLNIPATRHDSIGIDWGAAGATKKVPFEQVYVAAHDKPHSSERKRNEINAMHRHCDCLIIPRRLESTKSIYLLFSSIDRDTFVLAFVTPNGLLWNLALPAMPSKNIFECRMLNFILVQPCKAFFPQRKMYVPPQRKYFFPLAES